MKKLFVSILALAAFAACQSDFNDVNFDAPQGGSNVNVGGSHTIYAEVGVGEDDTKATYGDGLKATWEESDQLALLQEHANYGATFSVVNKLNIKDGWGTSKALFNGDISVDATVPRVYHIAYPASAVSFSTSSSMALDGSVSYYESNGLWGYYTATGTYTYTYNSTLNITVPTTQSGKWEPYMYASTSEAVDSNAIGAKTLTTLNGAIAIRAFEPDGKTPKQLKQIKITSSSAAIAGAFSGTATSTGSTGSITGAKSKDGSTVASTSSLKAEALANLESLAKTVVPTSTSVTKALSLSFAGSGKTITATNLDAIASEADGNYTYYVNVAPATLAASTLTIEATDVDGSTLKRVVDKEVTIAASHRAGFNLTWEDATLKGATIETWYNDWNKGSQFQLEGSTIYVDNVSVDGNISADQVSAIGVRINGEFHEASQQSGKLAISPIIISGLSSGVYKVQPVAKVSLNGEEKWLECAEVEKTVTSIPQVIDYSVRTSYSSNGDVAKTNDINGDILKVKANISDSYVANNLVDGKTVTICYGSKTATTTLGAAEKEIPLSYAEWGQYVCYVKILLGNGYEVVSDKYTTHVTGIPYTYDFYQGRADLGRIDGDGWKRNGNTGIQSNQLYFGRKTDNVGYVVSPKFHIPASFNTSTTVTHKCYSTTVNSNLTAYSGAVANQTSSAKTVTYSIKTVVDTSETGSLTTHTGNDTNVVLSQSTPYMCIGSNGCNNIALARYHYLHKVVIKYRL